MNPDSSNHCLSRFMQICMRRRTPRHVTPALSDNERTPSSPPKVDSSFWEEYFHCHQMSQAATCLFSTAGVGPRGMIGGHVDLIIGIWIIMVSDKE